MKNDIWKKQLSLEFTVNAKKTGIFYTACVSSYARNLINEAN